MPEESWWNPPKYQDNEEWKADDKWHRVTFEPDAYYDYSKLLDFAKQRYEETRSTFDKLDAKCEALIRFTSAMAAALFAILKFLKLPLEWPGISAYFCFLVAIILSFRILKPAKIGSPVSGRQALDSVPKLGSNEIQASMASSYHCAATATSVVNRWKALQLMRGHGWMILGLVLMFVGLFLG